MKNTILRRFFWILFSVALSATIFMLLAYAGLAAKFTNSILKISGNDHWEGETKSPYVFNAAILLFALIFIVVLLALNRLFFKTNK